MAWQEIPASIDDVMSFIPNSHSYKIKADEAGRLYYWIKETPYNKNNLSLARPFPVRDDRD